MNRRHIMDNTGIKTAIQTYFDACNEGSGEKMSSVMNDAAHVYGLGEGGTLNDMDKETFVKLVGGPGDPNAPKPDFPRQDEILSIDFTSENTAVARVKLRLGNIIFTDILTFIEQEGNWKIISKLYAGELV